jgi:CBS domain-containing protein
MLDSDDELRMMRGDTGVRHQITSENLMQPIERLFSKPALTVDVGQTVGEALSVMRERAYGAIVITRNEKVAGIITERDLICRIIGVVPDFEKMSVAEAMTANPITLRTEDPIVYVMHNMQVGGYRHVPIVDDEDRPVSIVSIKDVVRFVLSYFPRDVYNLTAEPYRGPSSSNPPAK